MLAATAALLANVLAALFALGAAAPTQSAHLKLAPAAKPQAMHLRAADNSPVPIGHAEYDGVLDGRQAIHLTVDTSADGRITGSYTTASNPAPVAFGGRIINATSLSATASGTAAIAPYLYLELAQRNTTQLSGSFYGDGESNLHYLVLELTSSGDASGNAPPVAPAAQLPPADAAAMAASVQRFLQAIAASQPDAAAKCIAFPLAYTSNGRRALLHTPADFIKKFAAIFSPAYLDQLKYVKPTDLSSRGQAAVLGDGLLWLDADGKIFALNNEHVRMFTGRKFMSNAGWPRKSNVSSPAAPASKP